MAQTGELAQSEFFEATLSDRLFAHDDAAGAVATAGFLPDADYVVAAVADASHHFGHQGTGIVFLASAIGGAVAAVTLVPMVNGTTGSAAPYIPAGGWLAVIGGTILLVWPEHYCTIRGVLRTHPIQAIELSEYAAVGHDWLAAKPPQHGCFLESLGSPSGSSRRNCDDRRMRPQWRTVARWRPA